MDDCVFLGGVLICGVGYDYYLNGFIDPERGLPETLTELSNQALRNHGRSERVSRTEGFSCQISESRNHHIRWDRVHYCHGEGPLQ